MHSQFVGTINQFIMVYYYSFIFLVLVYYLLVITKSLPKLIFGLFCEFLLLTLIISCCHCYITNREQCPSTS